MRKPIKKKQLGRPTRRRENDFEMDLREISGGDVNWINLLRDRD
jgi:hypothetical protein